MGSTKQPFERILSLIDRKKIFLDIISQKIPVVIKLGDGKLISFRGINLTSEGHMEGLLNEKGVGPAKQRNVTVFFYLKKDRFFLNTKLLKNNLGWRILNATDFYKLNRRESYRIDVPDNLTINFQVTNAGGTPCNVTARVVEFSAGGARIRWPGNPIIKRGHILKGTWIWMKGKQFSVNALVKHQPVQGIFGLEFIEMDAVQMNRMKVLSIELQQMVNYSVSKGAQ
jgi:hypothetical protein